MSTVSDCRWQMESISNRNQVKEKALSRLTVSISQDDYTHLAAISTLSNG